MTHQKPQSFEVADPGLGPGGSNFQSRALPAMAVDLKMCIKQNIPARKGIPAFPNSHSAGSCSSFICFIYWCLTQDPVCKRSRGGNIGWEFTALCHVPFNEGFSHRTESTWEHMRGKEGWTHQLHRRTPSTRTLCLFGLLLQRERKS